MGILQLLPKQYAAVGGGGGWGRKKINCFLPSPSTFFGLPPPPLFFFALLTPSPFPPIFFSPQAHVRLLARELTFCYFVKNCQHISFPHSSGTIFACSTRHAMTPVVESHVRMSNASTVPLQGQRFRTLHVGHQPRQKDNPWRFSR